MTATVQLPVQLPYSYRATSVSATPSLPIGKLHACTRAARLPHGIGSWHGKIMLFIPFIGRNSKAGFQLLIPTCALASKDHPLGPSAANTLAVTQPWPYSALARLPALRQPLAQTLLHESPTGFGGNAVLPRDSRPAIGQGRPWHNALGRNGMRRRYHLSGDQKDIYARALSRPSTLLEGKTREAPGSQPPAKRGSQRDLWDRPRVPFGIEGGGGKIRPAPDTRPIAPLSRLVSPKFGPACSEKVGLPMKASLRQVVGLHP
jgi:hypothetical protein